MQDHPWFQTGAVALNWRKAAKGVGGAWEGRCAMEAWARGEWMRREPLRAALTPCVLVREAVAAAATPSAARGGRPLSVREVEARRPSADRARPAALRPGAGLRLAVILTRLIGVCVCDCVYT